MQNGCCTNSCTAAVFYCNKKSDGTLPDADKAPEPGLTGCVPTRSRNGTGKCDAVSDFMNSNPQRTAVESPARCTLPGPLGPAAKAKGIASAAYTHCSRHAPSCSKALLQEKGFPSLPTATIHCLHGGLPLLFLLYQNRTAAADKMSYFAGPHVMNCRWNAPPAANR